MPRDILRDLGTRLFSPGMKGQGPSVAGFGNSSSKTAGTREQLPLERLKQHSQRSSLRSTNLSPDQTSVTAQTLTST